MAQHYFKGDKVQITNTGTRMYGKVGTIDDYSHAMDAYGIEFGTPGTLGHYYDWYDLGEFYPVIHIPSNPWNTQHTLASAASKYGAVGGDLLNGGTVAYSNSRCSHKWALDYTSPFVKKDYYSCSKCKIKKEEWEKEDIDDDGVPF